MGVQMKWATFQFSVTVRSTSALWAVGLCLLSALGGCKPQQSRANAKPTTNLQFHIVVEPEELRSEQLTQLRNALATGGKTVAEMSSVQWFPIKDLTMWSRNGIDDWAAFQSSPVPYFGKQLGLVAGELDGRTYLLLQTDEARSMIQSKGHPWTIKSARMTHGHLGEPVVGFSLDDEGTRRLRLLTRSAVGKLLAIVINGEVYACGTIDSPLEDGTGIIPGNFGRNQLMQIIRLLGR